jgi:excinuclease UvrABC nuclease subunit
VAPPEAIDLRPGLAAIETAPNLPAVFLAWAPGGPPYLGRTALLRRRLQRLFRESAGPSRLLNLAGVAVRVEYWTTASRLESSILFYRLAREHYPETYLKLAHLRPPPLVRLTLANQFPRTQVTTRLGGAGSFYYGPFHSRTAAEQFESECLDLFQVRRCQEDLTPSAAHPGCIYGEMNRCLRPCQMVVGVEEYRSEAGRLVEFLSSGGKSLLDSISAARARLSDELNFEEAARQHKRYEKVQEVLRLRDDLAGDVERLHGIAVTRSVAPEAVELWFLARGAWLEPSRFPLAAPGAGIVSMDLRLRKVVESLEAAPVASARQRQEHLALLARWYYSSWRDGEWIACGDFKSIPYRRLVNAVHRMAA